MGLGLVVEAVALFSNTPIAFLAFVLGGGGLVALGMGTYLYAAVNR